MRLIVVYYEQFTITQERLDCWHLVLSKYSFEVLHGNLLKVVKSSPHPPKISDLVQTSCGRYIPNYFELNITAGEKD